MKSINILLLVLLFLPKVSAHGYKGEVLFETKVLKEQNDSLYLEMDVHVRSSAVKDCQSLVVTPVLETSDNSFWFPYIQINGKNRSQQIIRWETLRGKKQLYEKPFLVKNMYDSNHAVMSYTIKIPYEHWMDSAIFLIREEFWDCAGEKRLYTFIQNNRIELEAKEPYSPRPQVNYILPPPEQKQRNIQGQSYLDFQVGRSVIIPTYRRNPEELAKITEIINRVKDNSDITITGLYIEGYASPEGSYATNERLSGERAAALKDYIQENFRFSQERFTVNSIAEDWAGLKTIVEQSDIPQKQRILDIIDSEDDYDRKEQRLKGLGASYKIMLSEMFPQLRRVEYRVDFTVRDYGTNEAKDLVGKNPEQLSQRELFLLAKTYPEDSPEYNNILEIISRLYPDDPIANTNEAARMLLRGENLTAKRYLDKTRLIPASWNNWGVYYLNTGDLDKAEEYFTKAAESGFEQAVHNLEEVRLKRKDNERMERYYKLQN